MPQIHESSTAGIQPGQRLNFWCDGARQIGGLRHSTAEGDRFEGKAKLCVLENLKIGRFEVSANEARWTHELIRQAPDSFLRFVYQCKGTAEIEQGEARFKLLPGHWTLLNATRPHAIRSTETIEELVVIVPRAGVLPRLFDASRNHAGPQRADEGMSRVMFDFARSVLDHSGSVVGHADESIAGAGMELVKAVLQERFDGRAISTCRQIRLERIRAFIDRNLSDPTLSVQAVADAMGCSKRYIHALFSGEQSVHNLIWEKRLVKSARDLTRHDLLTTSITTIALSHGFSCPAHFSRAFKAQYGLPPRDFRQRALNS